MTGEILKVGDMVRIKHISGVREEPGVVEYSKEPFEVIDVDNDMSDEFQGIVLKGCRFLMTNHDVEKIA